MFRVEIDPDTQVRLIRSTAVRMVQEEDEIKVGHFIYSADPLSLSISSSITDFIGRALF